MSMTDPRVVRSPLEEGRYRTLLGVLRGLRPYIEGRRVLDFGAGNGMALLGLLDLGAREVVGIEPEEKRVVQGTPAFRGMPNALLLHVSDTRSLPLEPESFDTVIANAVLEHIPQPRDAYILEMWRVLRPGCVLVINETPNKYVPYESHTTKLWFNHWLPREVAHRRAVRRGRFKAARTDWHSSGWRGLGYCEMVRPLRGRFELIPERTRARHRVLAALGVPASIADPYPTWMLRKVA